MTHLTRLAIAGLLVASACAGGSDSSPDAPPRIDGATADASTADAAMIDGALPDAAIDATEIDASPPDAMVSATSAEIFAARATADGTGLSLPISNATVTYLKPAIGSDPAGFTIQDETVGPALFVAVNPADLSPPPVVGDVVSFTITTMASYGQLREATAITSYTRVSQGANVNALVQDLTSATDVVSNLAEYESELVDVTGTIAGSFATAGSQFEQASISTTGIAGDSNFRLRLPTAVKDQLDAATSCGFTLNNVPVGRFAAAVQLPAYVAGDLSLTGCPAPVVVNSVALSASSVRVTFSRHIDPASVMGDGSQFTADNGLSITGASVNGREVTLTTTTQTASTTYTVTAASSVTDLAGTAVGTPASASFAGFLVRAVVRVNEVNANLSNGCDLIELRVVQGGSMNNFTITARQTGGPAAAATIVTFAGLTNLAADSMIVVHLDGLDTANCNTSGATSETTAPNEQPFASHPGNFDAAWDFWETTYTGNGLVSTNNVVTIYDDAGAMVDAVFLADGLTCTTAGGTETQAAAVLAASQWENNDGSTPAGGYVDNDFCGNAAQDLNGTSLARAGTSIQRLDDTDDDNAADWTMATSTWGALNPGQ